MPRNNFEFEEDEDLTPEGEGEGDGVEVDLSTAKKDDAEDDLPFDDLTPSKFLEKQDKKRAAKTGDADDLDEDDEPTDDEDEDEGGSRRDARPTSWRKRLLRAERLIEEVREENQDLVARNTALETRVSKRESDEEVSTKRTEAEAKLVGIRAALTKAKEDGDTKREVELTEEMSDVKADLKVLVARVTDRKQLDTEAKPVVRQPRLARQWLRRHQRYNTDPVFKAAVMQIDKQVASEQYDVNDEEYYEVLDERVKKIFPDEYKNQRGRERSRERETDERPRRRHPARGVDPDESQGGRRREEGAFRRTAKGVMLSPSQMANMRRFGMDPDNEQDKKDYVRNNLSTK